MKRSLILVYHHAVSMSLLHLVQRLTESMAPTAITAVAWHHACTHRRWWL